MDATGLLRVGFIFTQIALDDIRCTNSIVAVVQPLVSLQELPVICCVGTFTALVSHKVTDNVPLAFHAKLTTYSYDSVSNPLV